MYGIYEYTGPYYGAADSCRYDANGNLTYDAGRGITRISYNLMNLPDTVFFVNGNVIVNLYDAAGVRHKTTYITSPPPAVSVPGRMLEAWEDEEVTTEEVLYIGHIIRTVIPATEPNQVATVQCRINNAEGYVLKCMPDVPVQYGNTNSQYSFFYETRDHLGNIISVWDAGHEWLTQQVTYWPSGMPFTWRGEQHVTEQLMNGHEYIPMHGYDMYDFGFRHYYATIGRFTSPDPLSERTPWQSPYVYASNNFTGEIDWMGLGGSNMIGMPPIIHYTEIDNEGRVTVHIDDPDDNRVIFVDEETGERREMGTEIDGELYIWGFRPYIQTSYGKAMFYNCRRYKYVYNYENFDRRVACWLEARGMDLFDDWWEKHVNPLALDLALLNPLIGIMNDGFIIFSGQDIYGNQATVLDYIFAGAGFVDVGVFKISKHLLNKEFKDYLGKTLDWKKYGDIIYDILIQFYTNPNTHEQNNEPAE